SRRRESWPIANASSEACACSAVVASARVRHQRCAAVWLFFSTTPLRWAVELRREESRRAAQDRVGPSQFSDLLLQLRQSLGVAGRSSGPIPGVDLGLGDPVA